MSKSKKAEFLIVNIHSGSYWDIYLNGELVCQPYKSGFMTDIRDSDNIDEWSEKTGMAKKDFRYTLINLYDQMPANYDGNDYMGEYEKIMALGLQPVFASISLKELKEKHYE